jgi:hypothetical protein
MKHVRIISVLVMLAGASAVQAIEREETVYRITAFGHSVGRVVLCRDEERLRTVLGVRVGNIARMTQKLSTVSGPDGGVRLEEARMVLNGKTRSSRLTRKGTMIEVVRNPDGRTEQIGAPDNGLFFTFVAFLDYITGHRTQADQEYPVLLGDKVFHVRISRPSSDRIVLWSDDGSIRAEAGMSRCGERILPSDIRVERFIYRGINWNFLALDLEEEVVRGP